MWDDWSRNIRKFKSYERRLQSNVHLKPENEARDWDDEKRITHFEKVKWRVVSEFEALHDFCCLTRTFISTTSESESLIIYRNRSWKFKWLIHYFWKQMRLNLSFKAKSLELWDGKVSQGKGK